ncbi:hypothetical protein MARINON1_40269 [Marinobacter salarius]|nr:hypothetical protein MBHK15_70130 [Marinobacter salarius]VXB24006.1 hypothetical protein MARINON1_40269 [Marinobacter salarius]
MRGIATVVGLFWCSSSRQARVPGSPVKRFLAINFLILNKLMVSGPGFEEKVSRKQMTVHGINSFPFKLN